MSLNVIFACGGPYGVVNCTSWFGVDKTSSLLITLPSVTSEMEGKKFLYFLTKDFFNSLTSLKERN